jgi:enoyl-CoA hydratase/carnithine racemase
MSQLIRQEKRGPIFEIVLDRPDKRNAINLEMLAALDEALRAANRDGEIRLVSLRGEGKGFSAGIDLTTFLELQSRYGEAWAQRMRVITGDIQAIFNRLERLEIPTVALLHGHCLGLGMELALACDFRLCAEGTTLGLPEALLGLIPDVGGITRLTRLVGPSRAKELVMTGRTIDAACAERWGIVNRVVPAGDLTASAEAFAGEILKAAPLAVGVAKRVIDGLSDLDRGLMLEGWGQSGLVKSADFTEGVQSFLQRRAAKFTGN